MSETESPRTIPVPDWVNPRRLLPVDATARLEPSVDETGQQGLGWWVPLDERWEIPAGFEFSGGGPFDWAMWIHVVDGKPECFALKCWTSQVDSDSERPR